MKSILKSSVILAGIALLFLPNLSFASTQYALFDNCWSGLAPLNYPNSIVFSGTIATNLTSFSGIDIVNSVDSSNNVHATSISAFKPAICGGSFTGGSVDLQTAMNGQPDGQYAVWDSHQNGIVFFYILGGQVQVIGNYPSVSTSGFPPGLDFSTSTVQSSNQTVGTTGLPPGLEFFNQYATSSVGTSTLLAPTNLLTFLNVPALLENRVPFGYIFQFYSVLTQAIASTSASSIPTGTVVFFGGDTHIASTSVDLFSTSTVSYFLPTPILGILRGLMVAVVYLEMIWYLYHDARNKKHLF